MRLPSKNDLNAFGAGLLGFTGLSLLLLQASPPNGLPVKPPEVQVALGATCFILGLILQALPFLPLSPSYQIIARALSGLMLGYVSWLLAQEGQYPATLVSLTAGIVLFVISMPQKSGRSPLNLSRTIIPFLGLAHGIGLTLSQTGHPALDGTPYGRMLAVLFFLLVLPALTFAFRSSKKVELLLFRLQAIPWIGWCVALLSESPFHIITPLTVVTFILFAERVAWDQLVSSTFDVLGRRVLVTAALLEVTGLLVLVLSPSLSLNGFTLSFLIVISAFLYHEVADIVIIVNSFTSELRGATSGTHSMAHTTRLGGVGLLGLLRDELRARLNTQADQVNFLSRQLASERKRNAQLVLLNELSQQLENQLDQPVSAQLAVNVLERALGCSLVTLLVNQEDNQLMLLAAAGPQTSTIPPGYRQGISDGAIGRAIRQRKTQVINDINLDKDYVRFENEHTLSCVIVPMIFNGHVNGVLVLNHETASAFGSIEIGLAEAVAEELTRAWERSGYHQRLMNLVQAGSQLSSVVEPESTALEVASITRQVLDARFTFVQIQLGQENNFIQVASSGGAPKLLRSLEGSGLAEPLIQAAFHAAQPFRVRDVRKYAGSKLEVDHPGLRSMLAIPIRWHRLSIGAILAFGKQNEVFFTENDESLAELLSAQAAGAFESAWLQQELRASLTTTSLLYRLSTQIIQAENLNEAATDIAQTAHKLANGISTGIVLFSSRMEIEAEVQIDQHGSHCGHEHPMEMILQVMETGQLIYVSQGQSQMRACLPIQTPIRKYGVLWINIPEGQHHKPTNPADLQTLVSQAALALERSLLLVESRRQAEEIKNAYDMLETTYDQTLASLISALDARDSETEGHSMRVSQLVSELGRTLGFSREQLKVLERGSLLHDIGKIGISDSILHKPGALSEDEWKIMRQHPDIGARIVEGIPFLQETIPLIRHHQERWNGTGYPHGLQGEQIPELARIFAVVDAYDALTNDRPYRKKISPEEALQYLHVHAGVLFDPAIVEVFEKLMLDNKANMAVPE